MQKKLLLLGFYAKFGNDGISDKIARLGYVTDKLFNSTFEEVIGIIQRGHYNAFIVYLTKNAFLDIAKKVRAHHNTFPIIGVLSTPKQTKDDYAAFTEVITLPVNFDKLKEVLDQIL